MTSERARPARNEALRGASLAFGAAGEGKLSVPPLIRAGSERGDALTAALVVGRGSAERAAERGPIRAGALETGLLEDALLGPVFRVGSLRAGSLHTASRWEADEHRLGYQMTGSCTASGHAGDLDRTHSRLGGGFAGSLLQPGDKSHSPSFIAATLAASRSASVTPNHTGQQSSAAALRKRTGSGRSVGSIGSEQDGLDTRPIPSTGKLIGLFEQNAEKRKRPVVRKSASSASSATLSPSPSLESQPTPRPKKARPPSSTPVAKPSKPEIRSPKPSFTRPATAIPRSKPPPPRKRSLPTSKPIPIPSKTIPAPEPEEDSSDESFLSASSHKPSWRAALSSQNRRLTSASLPSTTIDSLANAIVASSLASSRAASPSRHIRNPSRNTLFPPVPPPRRSPHRGPHLFHGRDKSRTPSPAKGVLQSTLRKQKTGGDAEDEEGPRKRGRTHLLNKHPHKHHEGDRKRWRDEVTERERKRYDAVWASNKGLFLPGDRGGEVCNLVVRDVFSRSRLGGDVLEEVYDLVDRAGEGRLGREEFVVGLWLLDQRLKGRKLPMRVSASVWRSVGFMNGVRVGKVGR